MPWGTRGRTGEESAPQHRALPCQVGGRDRWNCPVEAAKADRLWQAHTWLPVLSAAGPQGAKTTRTSSSNTKQTQEVQPLLLGCSDQAVEISPTFLGPPQPASAGQGGWGARNGEPLRTNGFHPFGWPPGWLAPGPGTLRESGWRPEGSPVCRLGGSWLLSSQALWRSLPLVLLSNWSQLLICPRLGWGTKYLGKTGIFQETCC